MTNQHLFSLAVVLCATLAVLAGNPAAAERLLYSEADIAEYQTRMSGAGPFHARGDAGHGGQWSPNDGERAEQLAAEFLEDPRTSYWSQPDLPYEMGVPHPPHNTQYARPFHAAWIHMTQPDHPDRDALFDEVKAFLLTHATDSTLDFSDAANYTDDFPGFASGPIFAFAEWMVRVIRSSSLM